MSTSALIIAGTHSGSGKTTVTLAVMAALARRGLRVQGFKVGPDFIDPGHHARLTGRPGRNLDTWLLGPEALASTFRKGGDGADIAVIEGVMGLFDGRGALDERGSTADLARLWDLPVVLVADARGLARSLAPLVFGFATFDPTVRAQGLVANKVGGRRHYEEYLAPALKASVAEVEPLGYLTRDDSLAIPSRHLGLLTADELGPGAAFADRLADAAEATLDLDRLIALARPPRLPAVQTSVSAPAATPRTVRLALARDQAFCFYYEDNLDLLRAEGAEIVHEGKQGVAQLARLKALAVAARHPDRLVLGADTIVVCAGEILGKPDLLVPMLEQFFDDPAAPSPDCTGAPLNA